MPYKDREKYLAYQREYNERNRDKQRAYMKEYNTPEQIRNALLRRYNISEDEYNEILNSQDGVCAICGGIDNDRRLAIDHDHDCCQSGGSCGKCIRGLLCSSCNRLLGFAKEDVMLLRSAVKYLTEPVKNPEHVG